MAQQIQLRRDSAADWTSANPVLASGEVGVETDTGQFKLGDGSTAWTSLSYFTSGGGGGVTLEQVQDDLGNTSLIAGTSLTKVYDDGAGTITLNVDAADFATAAQGSLAATATQPGDLGDLAVQDTIAVPGDITATGTASSSTYLRGDGAWATPSGSGTVDISGTPVANDIARFTDADTIEGRSYAELLADLSLEIGTDIDAYAATVDQATAETGTSTTVYNWTPQRVAQAIAALAATATGVDVLFYDAGWPSRTVGAPHIFWISTDPAATAPVAATTADVVMIETASDRVNIDGGLSDTTYGAVQPLDGGGSL